MFEKQLLKASHLEKGDMVGLISPSAPMAGLVPHRVEKAVNALEEMGLRTRITQNALKITDYTAGSPKERADDINDCFKDKNIKAIISFIGGNHSNQTLKYIDFNLVKENPKIFLGYSDATVLHFAFLTQASLVTFYGPAALTQFAENPQILSYTREYLEKTLFASNEKITIQPSMEWTDEILDWFEKEDLKRPRTMKKNNGWQWLKKGAAEGPILGGCISSMLHLMGTKYWPDFSGAILFWEIPESSADFTKGRSLEDIDAYLTDLELSGVFKQIKGMIIGRAFGYTDEQIVKLVELIKQRTSDYAFPILYNVDIGHTDPMITVPLGINAKIDSEGNTFDFIEKGIL